MKNKNKNLKLKLLIALLGLVFSINLFMSSRESSLEVSLSTLSVTAFANEESGEGDPIYEPDSPGGWFEGPGQMPEY